MIDGIDETQVTVTRTVMGGSGTMGALEAPYIDNDAGVKAASRIRAKAAAVASATATFMRWAIGLSVLLAILIVSAIGYYGWENRVTGRLADDRMCKVEYKDLSITGKRTYSYPFMEIFGFRFIDTKAIDERTIVDIRGDAMMIIGQSGDDWWSLVIGMAEQGIQILKPSDSYTFVVGKKAVVVKSKVFCD